jgi:CubicO group peptidase (beta-lactamase class C family)
MTTRRGVLQAALFQGLATGFGSAMAQQSPRRKAKAALRKKAPNDRVPVEADGRVNDILAPVRDAHHLPGLVGGILTPDGLATIGAVGIRKIGSSEPFRVTDKIHLGSCSKAMTATVLGTLVDEGKLKWGSTIREVFPEQAEELHADFRTVTLSHLLTHRAGLPHQLDWWRPSGRTETEQRLSILTTVMTRPPRHRPGSTYEYSNVGYTLAGLMAETVTGQPWETLLRERLFQPLQMASAGFGSIGTRGTVDQPWGHRDVKGDIRSTQVDNAPVLIPAGGVHCSMADWARFAALHLAGARGRARLLKAATFRALHTPPSGFEYAGGWLVFQRSWAGGRALNHAGTNTAWYANIWLAPAINLGFLIATNQGGPEAEKAVDEAVAALIEAREFLLTPAVG